MIQCIVVFFTICCLLYWLNFLWEKIIDERLFTRWWWEISMFRFDAWCNERHKNKSQYLQDFFDSKFITKAYESFDLRRNRIMLHEQCLESCSCFHVSNNDSEEKNSRHNFSQRHFAAIQNTNSYNLYSFFFFVMISQWLLFYTDFRTFLAIFFWHHQSRLVFVCSCRRRTYRLYHSQSRSNSFVSVSFDSTSTSLYQVLFWFRVFDNNFALHYDLRFSMSRRHRCRTSMSQKEKER